MSNLPVVVAIDGQAGTGKSSVSRLLAGELGVPFLNTGVYFRLAALVKARSGCAIGDLAAELVRHDLEADGDTGAIDGARVEGALRSPEVTRLLPVVAADAPVREVILALERAWVEQAGSAVVEGRDIGTVAFPLAWPKFFLVARDEVRVSRRPEEGERVLARDRHDTAREAAPLQAAADAIVIDTSDMAMGEVVERMLLVIGAAERR